MKKICTDSWIIASVVNSLIILNITNPINALPNYVPAEHITLACGSSGDTTGLDGRKWTTDADNKFLLGDQKPSSSFEASTLPHAIYDNAPYKTARLSRSEFSYSFPVTSGPKLLRLYFYPHDHPGFHRSSAFFSVKANGFTLLSNFSADIHARAYKAKAFFREFCLVIEDGERVNLTLSPRFGLPDAYAFINAIAIISMPANLYYSGKSPYPMSNSTAMELMYRLNVGGSSISTIEDTGLFRIWDEDSVYLTVDQSSTIPVNDSIQLNLINVGNYTAPVNLYKTARSMGMNKTINDNYALTWEFKVDFSFYYLLRLHFCEIQPAIREIGDRAYRISIDDRTACDYADVIEWSGGNGRPVYKDYTVMIIPKKKKRKATKSLCCSSYSRDALHCIL